MPLQTSGKSRIDRGVLVLAGLLVICLAGPGALHMPCAPVPCRAEDGPRPRELSAEEKEQVETLTGGGTGPRRGLQARLLRGGKTCGPVLMEALKVNDRERRIELLELVRLLKIADAADAVIPLIRSQNNFVATAAVYTLGVLGNPRAKKPLLALYEEPTTNNTMRIVIIKALMGIGDRDLGPFLKGLLENPDPRVGIYAAAALGRLGNDEGYQMVVQSLDAENARLRGHALLALSEFPDKGAAELVAKYAGDGDSHVRESARMARIQLEMKGKPESEVVRYLGEMIKDPELSHFAAMRLQEIGSREAAGILRENLRDAGGEVRKDVLWYLYSLGEDVRITP